MASACRDGMALNLGQTLGAVDGHGQQAAFSPAQPHRSKTSITRDFDMLHVVPPQQAPDFIRVSPPADAVGRVNERPGMAGPFGEDRLKHETSWT